VIAKDKKKTTKKSKRLDWQTIVSFATVIVRLAIEVIKKV
jgi:hypothetical protein